MTQQREDCLEPRINHIANPLAVLNSSLDRSFLFTQLGESVVICEAASGDRYNWGNETDTEPAFLIYLGCQKSEVEGYIQTFHTFYRTKRCKETPPQHLVGFSSEIELRGLQRYSDEKAFGLDYLLESEACKHAEIDFDEYNYYATGYLPRW